MANLLTKLSEFTSYIRSTIHDSVSDYQMIPTDGQIEAYVRQGAKEFSKLWPRRNVKDITAVPNQYDYPISGSLENWQDGFSWIKNLEYPAGEQLPVYYKADQYMIYNGTHVRFLEGTPGDTNIIRIVYWSPHVVTATSSSIPELFEYSVANYAAALALESLAAKYSKAQNPDIQADVVSYQTKADLYRRLAKELREQSMEEWGSGDPETGGQQPSWNWYESDYGDYPD
jgi:hypothetical protein